MSPGAAFTGVGLLRLSRSLGDGRGGAGGAALTVAARARDGALAKASSNAAVTSRFIGLSVPGPSG